MQYAIYMPPGEDFSDPRILADLAQDAEQAGWDGFFNLGSRGFGMLGSGA
jgi:hypothetical protein